tara:strand:+ start:627 stop:1061 length:435 start_codon:yes stop_codon:yes gene_type:complete
MFLRRFTKIYKGVFVSNLTAKEERIAYLLAGGEPISHVSKAVNVSRPTIYKMMKNELFAAKIEECKLDIIEKQRAAEEEAFVDMDKAVLAAKKTILDLATNSNSDSIRLSASKFIVERYEPKPEVKPEEPTFDFAALLKSRVKV